MAELKNLSTLAQNVATAAATARTADINAAKQEVLTTVETTTVEKVIKNTLNVDVNQLATKAEVTAAGTSASEALAGAVSTLNGTISDNRTAAETALSNYRDGMTETISGINESIGANAQSITNNSTAIATNTANIAQAQADIAANATAIEVANGVIATKANAADVYTKAEVNELLGNAAGVDQIVGTYTKDKIDELLAAEMDVANTYSQAQADAKFATIANLTTAEGRINELETKCQTVIGDIQANATLATTANQTANDAQTIANGATTTANDAKQKAVDAKSIAGEAKTAAEGAVATANGAAGNAATALSTANTADGKADTAIADSADAVEKAEQAQSDVADLTSEFNSYKTSNDAAVASKASSTDLSDAQFALQQAINAKVDTAVYNAGIAAKVDTTVYETGLAGKVDVSTYEAHIADSYTRAQLYTKDDVYTKTEVNNILNDYSTVANMRTLENTLTAADATKVAKDDYQEDKDALAATIATLAVASTTNAAIALKADQATTYTKTEVDTAIAPLAVAADVTAGLALKANAADVYTKAEVEAYVNAAIADVLETIQAQLSGE